MVKEGAVETMYKPAHWRELQTGYRLVGDVEWESVLRLQPSPSQRVGPHYCYVDENTYKELCTIAGETNLSNQNT